MIRLNSQYAIKADERQYTLIEKRIAKEGANAGNEYDVPLSYHMTVTQLLRTLIRRRQREMVMTRDMTLQEAVKAFEEIEEETRGWLREGQE